MTLYDELVKLLREHRLFDTVTGHRCLCEQPMTRDEHAEHQHLDFDDRLDIASRIQSAGARFGVWTTVTSDRELSSIYIRSGPLRRTGNHYDFDAWRSNRGAG